MSYIAPTQAIVEIRRYTHVKYSAPVLQQRELAVVPFKRGPLCYKRAVLAAGVAPTRMDHSGSFTNEPSSEFADGASVRNYSKGYVSPIYKKAAKRAIKDRIDFIRDGSPDAKIVVVE